MHLEAPIPLQMHVRLAHFSAVGLALLFKRRLLVFQHIAALLVQLCLRICGACAASGRLDLPMKSHDLATKLGGGLYLLLRFGGLPGLTHGRHQLDAQLRCLELEAAYPLFELLRTIPVLCYLGTKHVGGGFSLPHVVAEVGHLLCERHVPQVSAVGFVAQPRLFAVNGLVFLLQGLRCALQLGHLHVARISSRYSLPRVNLGNHELHPKCRHVRLRLRCLWSCMGPIDVFVGDGRTRICRHARA
mmetsp:Transcript_69594/g.193644  ORF Transcript_69594/g.193644 Transcript_69594/m.193644 type:complete len:245 (+) Transcript_69594:453-1187(+)